MSGDIIPPKGEGLSPSEYYFLRESLIAFNPIIAVVNSIRSVIRSIKDFIVSLISITSFPLDDYIISPIR